MVSRVGSAGVCVADVVVCVVGDVDTDDCGVVVVGVDGCVCGGVGMWCDSVGVFDIVDGDAIVIARGCVACVCCVLDRIVVVDGAGVGVVGVGVGGCGDVAVIRWYWWWYHCVCWYCCYEYVRWGLL